MVSTVVVGDAVLQLPIGALADRVSRRTLFSGCARTLLLSSLDQRARLAAADGRRCIRAGAADAAARCVRAGSDMSL